jgi:hypothetical protein
MKTPFIPLLIACLFMTACDQINQKLGLEDPAKKEARQESEGKAVGSACRQSGRAIEDCYSIYSWLPKSPIFAGWREMDAYMRENQLETIAPLLPPPEPPSTKNKKAAISQEPPPESGKEVGEKTEAPAEKSAEKSASKH